MAEGKKPERILVTGGAGYIGCVLVPMLLDRGCHVTILDSFKYGAQPILAFAGHPALEIVKADVRDGEAVGKAVSGHDAVLHLAAVVGYPACAADPHTATTTNVDGTRNVVGAMSRAQRLVFASTGSTYGKVEGVATEETPIAPLTLYGRNKRDAEAIIAESGVPFVALRFATVFGLSPRMRLDLLVNDFVYQAIHNRQIILYEGHFRRTFLHCRDAASSFLFVLDNFDRMAGQVFNVGDRSMNYTKREVALAIREHVDYYLHEADAGCDPDQRDYDVDCSRLRSLGFKVEVDLDSGIRELVKVLSVLTVPHPLRNV